MSIDFEVAGENLKAAGKLMRTAQPSAAPSKLDGRGSGINGAKSCILGGRPLLALNFIIETSFFCTIFLIFSAIVQDKRPFFTTFDYIVAVIQALQFVDYKDVYYDFISSICLFFAF